MLSETIAALFILVGTIFCLISSIGINRFPDVYTRSHAVNKSSTLGVLFVLTGTFLFFLLVERYFSIKLFLGIFFVFLTAPVAAHMICRGAYRSNVPLAEVSVQDDLKGVFEEEK